MKPKSTINETKEGNTRVDGQLFPSDTSPSTLLSFLNLTLQFRIFYPYHLSNLAISYLLPLSLISVGWLKTVDEYYYGSRNDIQRAVVQNILNSVVKELEFNPDRKFIYVEQAFFQRWYAEQSTVTQTKVKGLVASGQLEMINGGTFYNPRQLYDYMH
jgi:hypothetical protein